MLTNLNNSFNVMQKFLWKIFYVLILFTLIVLLHYLEQEARLLHRNRTMLRVIEYFAKSLNVIRNDTL